MGEMHLAPPHLPRALSQTGLREEYQLTIYQHCDPLYFDLQSRNLEHETEVSRLNGALQLRVMTICCKTDCCRAADGSTQFDTAPLASTDDEKVMQQKLQARVRMRDAFERTKEEAPRAESMEDLD